MLLELSKHVGNLRQFQFSGRTQQLGAFNPFTRAASKLEKVSIFFFRPSKREHAYKARVDDTVAAFLACPRLCELEISARIKGGEGTEDILNLCRRSRLKRQHSLSVQVRGYEYLA